MILIKIGGSKDINYKYILEDIKALTESVIIMHGANHAMREVTHAMQKEEKLIHSPSGLSSRYSDYETMEIFTSVYCGLINKKIVALAISKGICAVGLSGIDGSIFLAKRKTTILSQLANGKIMALKDNFHGTIISINTQLLTLLIDNGYTPVLTAPAVTEEGEIVNIDNDIAIALLVKEMHISRVISFIDQPGLLKNFSDISNTTSTTKKIITSIASSNLGIYQDSLSWRMKKKLIGAQMSFQNGLQEMYIADGTNEHPIEHALNKECTYIYNDQ